MAVGHCAVADSIGAIGSNDDIGASGGESINLHPSGEGNYADGSGLGVGGVADVIGNGSGDGSGAFCNAGHGCRIAGAGNGSDGGIAGLPSYGVIGSVRGVDSQRESGGSANAYFSGSGAEADTCNRNGIGAAKELPSAVYGLLGVRVGGECIDIAHNDGVCVASGNGIGHAISVLHGLESFGNGSTVLHLSPEACFVLIVAGEGNALGIAVNCAAACCEKRGTGGALTFLLHAFANSHPNKGISEGRGDMVLNVAAINESSSTALNCPAVVVIGCGDAGVGGQTEIGGST